MTRVVAVVVAFNRAELLVEVLDGLRAQTEPLAGIVVVDNASTDGTRDVAAATDVDLVALDRNTGGAGGFAAGIARALVHHEPDWIWIMDDDSVPTPTAAAELRVAAEVSGAVLAASRVVWHDGRDHPMNTPRQRPFASSRRRAAAARAGGIPVRSASFVSILVRADAAREQGLPVADYFIWNDDFEYSTRLLRGRDGIYAPASVVIHKTKAFGSTDVDPGPRFYYEVRNKLWMLRRSASLNPAEKALYGGATVLRWARTWRGSTDRATLRDAFRRGWRDGWRTVPRPNATALADVGTVAADIAAVEAGRARG
ncbi:glycosyltransferase [Demequina sp. SYSU T00039]|uniref:Glycosyltransferase n=1 Tax=Demequina lignilytica TaxID=3051663 RepID=A0AAW7M8W8_9MICO|nr:MULTISPECIES: glycosyltransferase [unclassified Demequina]MDN4487781.1 glycosyltransferase [Demequina sp. SYSU T00039]MDN4490836.1 glycosyltransferase [Demequina sp. SYSU T00068]